MSGPKLHPVVILNDDVTSFSQVTQTLEFIFGIKGERADEITNTIHTEGRAVIGEFIYEIAEAKVADIEKLNNLNNMAINAFIDGIDDEYFDKDDFTDQE